MWVADGSEATRRSTHQEESGNKFSELNELLRNLDSSSNLKRCASESEQPSVVHSSVAASSLRTSAERNPEQQSHKSRSAALFAKLWLVPLPGCTRALFLAVR